MQRNYTKIPLGSYTITPQLVRNLNDFMGQTLPDLLSYDLSVLPAKENTAITMIYPDHAVKYPHATDYRNDAFNGELEGLEMELAEVAKHDGSTKAIVIDLSFNKEKDRNYLYMALQDDNAARELPAIENRLLTLLEQYRNNHHLIYRSEWYQPITFLGCGLFGSLTFLIHDQPLRSLFAVLFGLCICLFAFRYIKGYSTFDTSSQKNWNVFFKWFIGGIATAVLAIILFF